MELPVARKDAITGVFARSVRGTRLYAIARKATQATHVTCVSSSLARAVVLVLLFDLWRLTLIMTTNPLVSDYIVRHHNASSCCPQHSCQVR